MSIDTTTVNGVTYHPESPGLPHSIVADSGGAAFTLHPGDRWPSDTTPVERCEWADWTRHPYDTDLWASFWLRVDAPAVDAGWTVAGQLRHWPDPDDYTGRSPVWAQEIYPAGPGLCRFRVVTRSDPRPTSPANLLSVTRYEDPAFPLGQWTRLVHRVRLARTGDGLLQVWRDGVEVVPATALPVGYNDAAGPLWKFGVYRAAGGLQPVTVRYAQVEFGARPLLDRVSDPLPHPKDD